VDPDDTPAPEQDEAPVAAPESDPPATALPCPVADVGESPTVGATVAAPESHPAVGPEFDADEDEPDVAAGAGVGVGDPVPEELAEAAEEAGASDCEPGAAEVDALEEPVAAALD